MSYTHVVHRCRFLDLVYNGKKGYVGLWKYCVCVCVNVTYPNFDYALILLACDR